MINSKTERQLYKIKRKVLNNNDDLKETIAELQKEAKELRRQLKELKAKVELIIPKIDIDFEYPKIG